MEETPAQEEAQQLASMNFITFLGDLVNTAHLYLSGIHDPETDKIVVNLGVVKRLIDSIEMLEEKTQGNLTAPEANFLANSLYELRMGYVRAINKQEAAAVVQEEAPTPETASDDSDSSEEPS